LLGARLDTPPSNDNVMEKYELVEERLEKETDSQDENCVRITQATKTRNYISYCVCQFLDRNVERLELKACGRAINKTVTIAEILKRRVPGLHQITELSTVDVVEVYAPLEEGLDHIENTRHVSCLAVTLSRAPLDPSHVGYQAPLPAEETQAPRPTDSLGSLGGDGVGGGRGHGGPMGGGGGGSGGGGGGGSGVGGSGSGHGGVFVGGSGGGGSEVAHNGVRSGGGVGGQQYFQNPAPALSHNMGAYYPQPFTYQQSAAYTGGMMPLLLPPQLACGGFAGNGCGFAGPGSGGGFAGPGSSGGFAGAGGGVAFAAGSGGGGGFAGGGGYAGAGVGGGFHGGGGDRGRAHSGGGRRGG
ncbi:unnamed protein product, partial [Phaeothamnion confervicola]